MGRNARRIVHAEVPVRRSPSGLPIQHLVTAADGSKTLFLGRQWLRPGEEVVRHTHPVEEILTFLDGSGEATLGDDRVVVGPGVSLYIPPEAVHGFRNTGDELMHLLVVFPTPRFAATTLVGDHRGERTQD